MAFLDWITRRANARRDSMTSPEKAAPANATPQNRRTPDEIIGVERLSHFDQREGEQARTANGNPIIWTCQTKLPGGNYLHSGHSAEGFHSAMERPQDYFKPRQWGPAFPTADEAKDAALRPPEPVNDVTAASNEQYRAQSQTRSRGGRER